MSRRLWGSEGRETKEKRVEIRDTEYRLFTAYLCCSLPWSVSNPATTSHAFLVSLSLTFVQIRRFRLMLQPSQEAAGSALLHHDDDFEVSLVLSLLCNVYLSGLFFQLIMKSAYHTGCLCMYFFPSLCLAPHRAMPIRLQCFKHLCSATPLRAQAVKAAAQLLVLISKPSTPAIRCLIYLFGATT